MIDAAGRRQLALLAATLTTYLTPGFFPDPALAQYVMRGWLGCLFVFGLLRGWRLSPAAAAVIAVWEASTAICGTLYPVAPDAFEGLCDKGTGLPLTLPFLTGSLLALAVTIRPSNRNSRGKNG